jgi:hypothetical protein
MNGVWIIKNSLVETPLFCEYLFVSIPTIVLFFLLKIKYIENRVASPARPNRTGPNIVIWPMGPLVAEILADDETAYE